MDMNKEFSNICRICSEKQKNVIRIFGEEGKGLYLQAKIRKYLYITVTLDDHFPKVLCESCCAKLNGIHTFATMANRTQDKFGKLFAKSTVADNKNIENHSLLHSYLTKGTVEKNGDEHGEAEPGPENEITEMEVRIDPMLILQCSPEETLSSSPSSADDDTNLSSASMKSETSAENYTKCRKPYNCSICPRRFISQFALQSHMWSHLSYKKVLSNNDNVLPKKDTQQSCVQSEQEQEPNDITCDNTGNMRFACPVCGKDISTKGNLKVHLETHRPKGRYGCDICGRVFKTQSNLYRHKEYHGGVQYPCTVCGRVYPTNSTLRAHSITHSDLRPHKCPLCDKTFKRNQDLKFHINQHTGARPYRCPYCPKAFASSGNCFSHRKRMHPLEVERDRERAAEIMR